MKRTDTKTLIEAARVLSREIQSEDSVANAALAEIADRLEELEDGLTKHARHLQNIYQDRCENAYCEASVADSFRQALAEISPDHPALKGAPPSFGVWESLSKENEMRAQDTARLNWLDRENIHMDIFPNDSEKVKLDVVRDQFCVSFEGVTIRQAVDRAMKDQP